MIDNNSDLSKHFGKNTDNIHEDENNQSSYYIEHDDEYYENIRHRMRQRRILAEKRRVRRNRILAVIVLLIVTVLIFTCCFHSKNKKKENNNSAVTSQSEKSADNSSTNIPKDEKNNTSDNNTNSKDREVSSQSQENLTKTNKKIERSNGITFIDGILIVNKTYSLPSSYKPQTSQVAYNAFEKMANAAAAQGISLFINSGYRSYAEQKELYDGYVSERGTKAADEVSSRPGHSEHQSGLSFDVNSTEFSFENTQEAKWLEKHCCEYGFIIRYPKGKEKQTGFTYEPWHIRYIGVEKATLITQKGLCLEEYLGITSDYKYADN